jgi:hypothetical protein
MELHVGLLYSEMFLCMCTQANRSDAPHQTGPTNNTKVHFMEVLPRKLTL